MTPRPQSCCLAWAFASVEVGYWGFSGLGMEEVSAVNCR